MITGQLLYNISDAVNIGKINVDQPVQKGQFRMMAPFGD